MEEAFDTLVDEWNEKILAFVAIEISQTNFSPVRGEIQLKGPIFDGKDHPFKSSKLFQLTNKYTIVFGKLECSAFTFVNGTVSNFLDSAEVDFEFRDENKKPVSEEALEAAGYQGFALRAFLLPTTPTYAKLSILLYHVGLDDLLNQNPKAVAPHFPGVLLVSHEIPFLPTHRDFFGDAYCGLPFTPALISEAEFTEEDRPATEELIASLSALMRNVFIPEARLSVSHSAPRWAAILEKGEDALRKEAPVLIWPDPISTQTAPGGIYILFFVLSFLLFIVSFLATFFLVLILLFFYILH